MSETCYMSVMMTSQGFQNCAWKDGMANEDGINEDRTNEPNIFNDSIINGCDNHLSIKIA